MTMQFKLECRRVSVGGGFQILSTVNIGNYIVHSIKDDGSILTLRLLVQYLISMEMPL